ncbi:MAG TPA: hypothetical protein VMB84_13710 [Stellaceae bacterium]|nr:hypothetical protein [Stellaceae bacterium]
MPRRSIPTPRCGPKRVSAAVELALAVDADPAVKAQRLRALAAWYRSFAARAANPVIWEARLLTAEHLDAEANCIDPQPDA